MRSVKAYVPPQRDVGGSGCDDQQERRTPEDPARRFSWRRSNWRGDRQLPGSEAHRDEHRAEGSKQPSGLKRTGETGQHPKANGKEQGH